MFGAITRGRKRTDKHAEVSPAAFLIERADAARDAGEYREAAVLYREALRLVPDNAGIHVQCGHMLKEANDLTGAEESYLRAKQLTPDDPDLALQLGHFYKVAGRLDEAQESYARAVELRPDWQHAVKELNNLRKVASPRHEEVPGLDKVLMETIEREAKRLQSLDFSKEATRLSRQEIADRLVPELFPKTPEDMLQDSHDSINVRRLGKRERSYWGMIQTLRGVEAIRGFCIASVPVVELQITLNGLTIHRGPLKGGYTLQYERDKQKMMKYVFNAWCDFSSFPRGRYELELRFMDANRSSRSYREHIAIASPLLESDYPDSDGVVTLSRNDKRSAEAQIGARPSAVRPAARHDWIPNPIRNALILRTDQLGDMVTSIPAMKRLRQVLPDARLVGLLTTSNVELAETLGLFDEIITIDFKDDMFERRRIMPLDYQRQLGVKLAAYEFDIALDLANSSMSRPLLLLSGAKFLYGFQDQDWPWLTSGFTGNTRDPRNGGEIAPHSTKVLGLIDRLDALVKSRAEIIRRPELGRDRLQAYGIGPDDRFAVLHTGARIVFSRWPHYQRLAAMLLEQTELKVVLMTDDEEFAAQLSPELASNPRFQLIDRRLPFDDFDALLSFCQVFVGNDSGPKHLAALRGSNVVSIHSARINWGEWGQELVGSIVSRRVPCAGCALYHDADECGKDWVCITGIPVEDVFRAMSPYM